MFSSLTSAYLALSSCSPLAQKDVSSKYIFIRILFTADLFVGDPPCAFRREAFSPAKDAQHATLTNIACRSQLGSQQPNKEGDASTSWRLLREELHHAAGISVGSHTLEDPHPDVIWQKIQPLVCAKPATYQEHPLQISDLPES
jgi:hypothetical protein